MGSLMIEIDNDTRGWILCIVSGTDSIVRLFPGKRNFRIQNSNAFLACSLSLSFGVMLFSALYSMLPESKGYLKNDNFSDQIAGLIMMGCFTGGFFGIQAISRLLHQFMPSHVVDCDHSHQNSGKGDGDDREHDKRHSQHQNGHAPNGHAVESSPLLDNGRPRHSKRQASARGDQMAQYPDSLRSAPRGRAATHGSGAVDRRPSMFQVQRRVMSFVKDTKNNCDESGSCYGFSDPCGQECYKHMNSRSSATSRNPTTARSSTGPFYSQSGSVFQGSHAHDQDHNHEEDVGAATANSQFRNSRATLSPTQEVASDDGYGSSGSSQPDDNDPEAQHHHHVPTNAFLSIGLQTSIAIALHKFPEGFITYATNHANPSLGFNVFMALFVHNISEGFAMCLPLYMALGSRWRAILWSAALGGLSQPLGASIAVLWFKLADHTNMQPNPAAYGCLFAVTSGIMVSVALQLFVESLSMNHNRNLCMFFGFLGMALLGLSNALFADH